MQIDSTQLFRLAKERCMHVMQIRELSANHKPSSLLDYPLERINRCLHQSSKVSEEEV